MIRTNQSIFLSSLIFLFPVFINSVKVTGDLILFITFLIGLYLSIARRETPFGTRHLKLASAVVLFYFFVITLSIVFSER